MTIKQWEQEYNRIIRETKEGLHRALLLVRHVARFPTQQARELEEPEKNELAQKLTNMVRDGKFKTVKIFD